MNLKKKLITTFCYYTPHPQEHASKARHGSKVREALLPKTCATALVPRLFYVNFQHLIVQRKMMVEVNEILDSAILQSSALV